MQRLRRILLSSGAGALAGAVLSCLSFGILSLADATSAGEAFAYALIAGLVGGFVGLGAGALVSIANLGARWATIVGVVITLALVAFYVFGIGRPGQYGAFFRESALIVVVFALPIVASAIVAALVGQRVRKA